MKKNVVALIMAVLLLASFAGTSAVQEAAEGDRITLSQLIFAVRCMLGQATMTEEESHILDIDGNGRITLNEIVTLAKRFTAQSAAASPAHTASPAASATHRPGSDTARIIKLEVGGKTFEAALADTPAAMEFAAMIRSGPLTIRLSEYGGWEKVGSLCTQLPTSNAHITAEPGDIMLYNGREIVLFYGTNTWMYTRLAKVDNLDGWDEALSGDAVVAVFSM